LPKNSVVLASVDFSHYLPESVASFHDELSRNVLAVGDLGRVSKLEVDSPKSLYFLLYYNQLKEAQKFTLLSSTNSGTISENSTTTETTSHIIGYYTTGKPAESPITTVQFFGDIMLDRNVAKAMGDKGLEYLLAKLKGQENRFFYGMDYLIANLEGPFAQARVPTTKTIAFRFDPKLAAQIKSYGFTAVSLANNHTLDMGWANVAFTHETLDKAGIGHFGDELREGPEYTWFSKLPNGTGQIAFIGINTTDHPIDTAKISTAIKDAKAKAQYVMVMMHWGVEYQRISREQERDLARSFIDQGVSAVIGAHPHVIEESELYKGKPIFYSLGNFVFDQYFSQETQEGLSVGLVLQDGAVKKVYAFPMFGVKSQVQLMNGTRRDDFLNWLNENSRLDGQNWSVSERYY
jgi:poly-gamma-glutamate synthesis protein (capsule biosynthesis protein)